MTIITDTRFRDLARREAQAFDSLVNTLDRLNKVEEKRALSEAEKAERDRAKQITDEVKKEPPNKANKKVCDPLFVATRRLLNEQSLVDPQLRTQFDGQLFFESDNPSDATVCVVALTLGILILDKAEAPPVTSIPSGNTRRFLPNESHPAYRSFTTDFFASFGEASGFGALSVRVLNLLALEGDPDGQRGNIEPRVGAEEFARVMRGLADLKVGDDEFQLRRRVNEVLDRVQNVGFQDNVAELGIDLPDLEDIQDENIVADNVRAMGPMIVSAMFDELKVFDVVDRIVEQFQQGMLPIGPGNAGKLLYRYWRETPNRISEQERKNFAAITLGIPGGDPSGMVNREFNDLWLRFVSSVSSFIRQNEVDQLLRSATPSPISHQQVRKSARDLAANLSLHGFGMAHFAAREIQSQVKFMIALLQDPEILGSYGARDMWQVVDQVATIDLGGARTSSRYRTLATCGTIITAWLADNVVRINRTTGPVIDIDQVRNPDVASNHRATLHPTDYDLVNACELWLADTATSDSQVEEMAQPREAPQMTSKPIQIPALARDMLDGLGDIGLGLGSQRPFGNGRPPTPH
ncbi:MAG TPA: hypothetical protein VIT38_12845 [Allosphingosinicella sp.]|jgi:hypothetical protein